jgi:heterodisulfide reductase subunit B
VKYCFFPGCSYQSAAGYRQSVEAVNRKLGIELNEIADWNCCGATVFFAVDEFKALTLAGRNFALAQSQGYSEIITGCNACYTTLRKAAQILESEPRLLERVNVRLARGRLHIEGGTRIRHYLEILADDVPPDAWPKDESEMRKDTSVAAYYGCQLTRPWGDLDHPERPRILERLIERLGFTPVEHSASTLCCGASHTVPHAEACRPLISRIVREVEEKGADLVTVICPLCQFNLDDGQRAPGVPGIPVPYFSQLAGIALGLRPKDLGLDRLLVTARGILGHAA